MAASTQPTPMFGLYLIPPASLVAPLSLAHVLLEKEFGCVVAGRFMVHVTVKGFFKPKPGADIDRLVSEIDQTYAGRASFPVSFRPPARWRSERGASVFLPLASESLDALHQATWRVIEPYVAEDCPFTPGERPGVAFYPHLTLVQYDLPSDPVLQDRAFEQCCDICERLPAQSWDARDLQLIRFESDDWPGRWWETLRFQQLKGWRLGAGEAGGGA
jgi:2'-5' RNA ligase